MKPKPPKPAPPLFKRLELPSVLTDLDDAFAKAYPGMRRPAPRQKPRATRRKPRKP